MDGQLNYWLIYGLQREQLDILFSIIICDHLEASLNSPGGVWRMNPEPMLALSASERLSSSLGSIVNVIFEF